MRFFYYTVLYVLILPLNSVIHLYKCIHLSVCKKDKSQKLLAAGFIKSFNYNDCKKKEYNNNNNKQCNII